MDCEKFDLIVMDLLCEELDELPRAAALRHVQQCGRCRPQLSQLRATREVAKLPLVEPPLGLAARIIAAEREVRRDLPLGARISRALTIAAGYAMRPQLAMAALLVLMIGSGLMLLRPRPGAHSVVRVTEHGVPEADQELVVTVDAPTRPETSAPAPPAPEPALAASAARPRAAQAAAAASLPSADDVGASEEATLDPAAEQTDEQRYTEAMALYRAGDFVGAQSSFDELSRGGGKTSAAAELYAALATERSENCAAALPRFDAVSASNPSNDLGHQATWHSVTCRIKLGQNRRAALDLNNLIKVPAYSRQAMQALIELNRGGKAEAVAAALKRSAPEPANAATTSTTAPPAPDTTPAKALVPASRPKTAASAPTP